MGLIEDAVKFEEDKVEIENKLEVAVKNIINSTTYELMTGEEIEVNEF